MESSYFKSFRSSLQSLPFWITLYALIYVNMFECLFVSVGFTAKCAGESGSEYSGALVGLILDSFISWNCFSKFNRKVRNNEIAKTKIFFIICAKYEIISNFLVIFIRKVKNLCAIIAKHFCAKNFDRKPYSYGTCPETFINYKPLKTFINCRWNLLWTN